MAGEDLLQIRVTADFKQAEESFLKLSKTATTFESDIRKISANVSREFNKIEGSAELFGNSTTVVADKMKVLKNAMENLMSLGFQAMNPHVQKLKAQYDELGKSLDAVGPAVEKSSKKMGASNKTMMSLSLILQDLPYGFRGIQNNLPALVGSFAAATGAIYLGFSALIAITTAYEKEIVQLIYGIDDLSRANKKLNEAVADNEGQARSQIATDQSLIKIINDTTQSTENRTRALDQLKEKYKGNLELQKIDITDGDKLAEVYKKISNALIRKARATAYASLIAEEEAKILKLEKEQGEEVVKNLGFMNTAYQLVTSGLDGAKASSNIATAAFNKQAKQIATSRNIISAYTAKLDENSEAIIENGDAANLDTTPPKTKKGKTPEEIRKEQLEKERKANEAETKAYIDTLDERGKKEYEVGLKLAENLQVMRNAGYTDSTTYYAAYRAEMDKIDAYYNNKQIEEARKTAEQMAKDALAIDNRQLQNSLDALKIESDVAMKIANLSGNATAADRIKILENYKNSLYDLASVGGWTAEQFDKIDDALLRVDAAIEGSKDRVKDYTITWQDTVNTINGILTNLNTSIVTNFAEQLGEMIAGGKFDISKIGTILADGLSSIGKALIAFAITNGAVQELFKNPKTWPLALAAGIAAVAAGSALKSTMKNNQATAFANGGIVSGPTMGLVGEYPGAQNNPEVIAPLDKLKSMIGGGGSGTFVLRGQDLLLSVNRAQKASNLKGQNISLI
jgi:hypothetical protein